MLPEWTYSNLIWYHLASILKNCKQLWMLCSCQLLSFYYPFRKIYSMLIYEALLFFSNDGKGLRSRWKFITTLDFDKLRYIILYFYTHFFSQWYWFVTMCALDIDQIYQEILMYMIHYEYLVFRLTTDFLTRRAKNGQLLKLVDFVMESKCYYTNYMQMWMLCSSLILSFLL